MSPTQRGCALITGGSRGIGAAISAALAAEGWPVGVNYRSDETAAAATVAEIEQAGGRALALQADVTDPEQVQHAFERLESTSLARSWCWSTTRASVPTISR